MSQAGALGAAENDTSSPDDEKALRQLEWEDETQVSMAPPRAKLMFKIDKAGFGDNVI